MNRLNLVAKFRVLMAFFYMPLGFFILFSKEFASFLQGGFRIAFGLLLIGYGLARIYMTFFKSKSNQDRVLNLILIFLISSFLSVSCGNSSKSSNAGTEVVPTIYIDETLEPVIKEEVFVFSAMEGSEIKVKYVPEYQAVERLLQDSTSLVIICNPLNRGEIKRLNDLSYYPKTSKIAVDAVALITNNDCRDSVISISKVRDILTGKITKWNEISKNGNSQPIQLVFDNKESSTVKFMVDSVCKGEHLGDNLTALKLNKDVIDFVATNKNSIGLIGVSWISDRKDSLHLSFHNKIKVLSISHNDEATVDNSYKPYQAYMYEGVYPFTRGIYVINNEPFDGLLSRFAAFLSNDKGQRIIYKAGLFPAFAPIRMIQVKTEF